MEEEKSELRKALHELKKMQSDSSTNLPTNDSEYTLSNILGQGRFGIVRLAYQGGNRSKPCVLKLYNKVKLLQANALHTVEVTGAYQNEVKILERMNHPNIVKLIEHNVHSQSIQVMLEYVGCLNLYDYIESNEITEKDLRNIFRGVCEAIRYLHSQKVCHRDLKLENIVLADGLESDNVESKDVKLIDFGFAETLLASQDLVQQVGTPVYMAPELALKKKYNGFKIDIWALGILLYRMVFKEFPYKAKDCHELYSKIANEEISYPKCGAVRDSTSAHELISQMLQKDPCLRPNITEVR